MRSIQISVPDEKAFENLWGKLAPRLIRVKKKYSWLIEKVKEAFKIQYAFLFYLNVLCYCYIKSLNTMAFEWFTQSSTHTNIVVFLEHRNIQGEKEI